MSPTDWQEQAKELLKAEMKRRGVSYKDFSDALKQVGGDESEATLRVKMSRGAFSAAFFVQCAEALGCGVQLTPRETGEEDRIGVLANRAGISREDLVRRMLDLATPVFEYEISRAERHGPEAVAKTLARLDERAKEV